MSSVKAAEDHVFLEPEFLQGCASSRKTDGSSQWCSAMAKLGRSCSCLHPRQAGAALSAPVLSWEGVWRCQASGSGCSWGWVKTL